MRFDRRADPLRHGPNRFGEGEDRFGSAYHRFWRGYELLDELDL